MDENGWLLSDIQSFDDTIWLHSELIKATKHVYDYSFSSVVVNCGPLQKPDHGDIIQQVGTTFGNRIVFECTEKGYEIRGSKVRTCQSDGSWSGLPTTCERE